MVVLGWALALQKMNPPKYPIVMANGTEYFPPLYDPVVAAHFANPASNVETLLEEINVKEVYAPLFEGKQDLTFLDIGANIGLVSIYAYDACQRIVSVEPAPETFKVLKAMTFQLSKIEQVQAALAPVDGPCEFFQNEANSTASSTVNTYGRLTEVRGLTLASILSIHQLEHIDVLKCDAEGSEGESLNFDQISQAAAVIDCVFCEVHNCPKTDWQHKLGTLVSLFARAGYGRQEVNGMRLIVRK